MKRTSFVVLLCAALMILSIPAMAATALKASDAPDHITLTWAGDPTTTQTVTWRTDSTVKTGYVQYAKASTGNFPTGATQVTATASVCSTDIGNENLHSVTLTGLTAGEKYTYRVGDGTKWSASHSFTTEAANTTSFKFLIFGDSQSGEASNPEYGPWKTTVQNAYSANPDAKFFVNVGDLVESGYSGAHWDNWFDAASGVIDTISFMPVQGNHETYTDASENTTAKPVLFTDQFNLPQNGPTGLTGQTYSYNYGNVHFVVLDSQEAEEASINGSILAEQSAWLAKDLSANTQKWTIVLFHKTMYYNKATRTNEDIKAAFQPVLDKYHVDVVLNGHDHGYSRTYPIYGDSIVSSPAKGTVYIVTGRSGNKYYKDLSSKVWDAFFYDPQDEPNYLTAEVDGSKLTIKSVKQDGTIIDSYAIDKSTGTDNPQTIVPAKSTYTRLAIYGDLLQTPLLTSAPSQINGKWYLPARSFAAFLGGTIGWNSNDASVSLTISGTTATVKQNSTLATLSGAAVTLSDTITKDSSGTTLISADDLKQLFGFSYKYDTTTNMLLFTK